MQSPFSTNTRCSDNHHFQPVVVIHRDNILDDLDDILDEIAIVKSNNSSPSNMTWTDDEGSKKPRATRHLESEDSSFDYNTTNESLTSPENRPKAQPSIRRRFESVLDVDVHSRESRRHTNFEKGSEDKENLSFDSTFKNKFGRSRGAKRLLDKFKKDKEARHSTVVWVIEPTDDRNSLRFKFTTEQGAYLILKAEEALTSIDIMNKERRDNTFFQVYSVDGTSSRVIGAEQITTCMEAIVAESKTAIGEDDDSSVIDLTTNKIRVGRLGDRFHRVLLIRRWKRLVRRQVRIAKRDNRPVRLFTMAIRPFTTLWQHMTHRSKGVASI